MQLSPSAHADTFCRDNLPPDGLWPDFLFTLPELQYPERLNAAAELLDATAEAFGGGRPCLLAEDGPPGATTTWCGSPTRWRGCWRTSSAWCRETGCCCAARTTRGSPRAGWACSRPGAVAVTTMSLLRSGELATICEVARPAVALCDHRFTEDLAAAGVAGLRIVSYGGAGPEDLDGAGRADAAQLLRRGHRRRRRGDDRVHLGHDRPAQGGHALPSRPARDRGHVLRPRAQAARRRHLHRHPAAGVHLRARRAAGVPAAGGPRPCCWRRRPPRSWPTTSPRTGSRCCPPRRPRSVPCSPRARPISCAGCGGRCPRASTCPPRSGRRSTTPPG